MRANLRRNGPGSSQSVVHLNGLIAPGLPLAYARAARTSLLRLCVAFARAPAPQYHCVRTLRIDRGQALLHSSLPQEAHHVNSQ